MAFDNNKGVIAGGPVKNVKIGNKTKITVSVGVVVFLALILGVIFFRGGNDAKNILGTWDSDNGYVMEFMSNGVVRQGNGDGWDMEGNFELLDDDILYISDKYGYDNVYFDIKFIGKDTVEFRSHDDPAEKIVLRKRK